jgi:hypothetical protein
MRVRGRGANSDGWMESLELYILSFFSFKDDITIIHLLGVSFMGLYCKRKIY